MSGERMRRLWSIVLGERRGCCFQSPFPLQLLCKRQPSLFGHRPPTGWCKTPLFDFWRDGALFPPFQVIVVVVQQCLIGFFSGHVCDTDRRFFDTSWSEGCSCARVFYAIYHVITRVCMFFRSWYVQPNMQFFFSFISFRLIPIPC